LIYIYIIFLIFKATCLFQTGLRVDKLVMILKLKPN